MPKTKFTVFSLVCFLVFTPLLQAAEGLGMRDRIEKVRESVFLVKCPDIDTTGTAFAVSKDGILVTNYHVIAKLEGNVYRGKIQARFSRDIRVSIGGEWRRASLLILAKDLGPVIFDYAILKVDVKGLEPLRFADYGDVYEGEDVYFMGFPFGDAHLSTHRGMISSKYSVNSGVKSDGKEVLIDVVQIDGSVNKGNSGAPLLNMDDEVIGIITVRAGGISAGLDHVRKFISKQARSGKGGQVFISGVNLIAVIFELINTLDIYISPGIGFAVSTEYVENHLEKMRESGEKLEELLT